MNEKYNSGPNSQRFLKLKGELNVKVQNFMKQKLTKIFDISFLLQLYAYYQ